MQPLLTLWSSFHLEVHHLQIQYNVQRVGILDSVLDEQRKVVRSLVLIDMGIGLWDCFWYCSLGLLPELSSCPLPEVY